MCQEILLITACITAPTTVCTQLFLEHLHASLYDAHAHEKDYVTSPVGLPNVEHVRICDAHVCRLEVQEVKEVLDCLGNMLVIGHREKRLEEVIHIRLENTLLKWKDVDVRGGDRDI